MSASVPSVLTFFSMSSVNFYLNSEVFSTSSKSRAHTGILPSSLEDSDTCQSMRTTESGFENTHGEHLYDTHVPHPLLSALCILIY